MLKMQRCLGFCLLLINFTSSSTPTILHCSYSSLNFYALNEVYSCEVTNNPNINSESLAAVGSVSGNHLTSKSNPDVLGLYIYSKILEYFPQNLENFFANLKLIYINNCGMKEVHQEDLKPFEHLTSLYLGNNAIEVIEQDLFAYNPNLIFIAFDSNKIAHIDSNVFDNLDMLTCFWFTDVPCVNQQASNSRERTKELINKAKLQCISSEFVNLEEQIKGLESDAKTLNFEDFKLKLEAFGKSFVKSKFARFRPLKNKFGDLKKATISSTTEKSTLAAETTSNSCKTGKNSADDSKFEGLESRLKNFLDMKLEKLSSDLKSTQCDAKDSLDDLLSLKSSITNLQSQISTLASSQESVKSSQTQSTAAINSIKSSLNSLKDTTKQSQEDIKTSLSDMEATFSDLKLFQNDVKSSLNKLKTTQNEIKMSLNEVKAGKIGHSDDKLENFEEKLENLQQQFGEFEVKNAAKLDKIEKEVTTSRHKNAMNLDEKIKGVENRIMKKIEEVLMENLGKIIEDKLSSVIDSKFKKD